MAVSRLLRQRMLQGDQALERCNGLLEQLDGLADALNSSYDQLLPTRDELAALRDELMLSFGEQGLLDGKNAELRSAQLGNLLAKSPAYQALATKAKFAERDEYHGKREWETLTLKLQASRAEVALRTAQIGALAP